MLLAKFLPSQYNGTDYQGRRVYNFGGGGGGGGHTTSTVTQQSIPDWLRPQTEALLGGATKEFFTTEPVMGEDGKMNYNITGVKPFVPYSANPADYVAGFSPLQQQTFFEAANMQRPGQYGMGSEMAGAAGMGGLETAGQAMGYGGAGFDIGQMGQQIGQQAALGAEQRARGAEQGAYGYGSAGYGAGLEGQQAGMLGQQIGVGGGTQYGGMGAGYGMQAANLAPAAMGYGQGAATAGGMGIRGMELGSQVSDEARRYARQAAGTGQAYEQMATDPSRMQSYMSPYMQNVVNLQKQAAVEDYQQNIMPQLQAQAVKSGAFGGSRDAIQRAMAQRNLASQLQNIQATGTQKAFEDAQRAQQFGVTAGLQGLQGAQQGLGTSLQGGQLGLSGIDRMIAGQQAGLQGLGQAGQLYGLGIQGAQTGLSGIDRALAGTGQGIQGAQAAMQGAGLGLSGIDRALAAGQLGLAGADRALAGTGQGLQGAQIGLQGVSGAQAGYGLTGQMGKAMADIGTAQQASDIARMQLQGQLGGMQQANEQAIINQAIQNYAMAQENPARQLEAYNAILRGYVSPTTTQNRYQATPSMASQLGGLGMQGAALYGMMGGGKKKGGAIKEKKYAEGGITSIDQKVINDPTSFSPEMINQGIASGSISKMAGAIGLSALENARKQAQAANAQAPEGTILGDLQGTGMAGGGMVAFDEGGLNDPKKLRSRDAFYQSIGMGGYEPEYTGSGIADPKSLAEYMEFAKKHLIKPKSKEEEEYEKSFAERPAELAKQREMDRYMALLKAGARMTQTPGSFASALGASTEAALPEIATSEKAYREGMSGIGKERAAMGAKRRAEETEAAKTGLELYSKAEQRRASEPNMQKYADNYVKMRQAMGDKRPYEVLYTEGSKDFLISSQGPAFQSAAAASLRSETDVDKFIADERKDMNATIMLSKAKVTDRNREMVEDAKRQVAEMEARHEAMRKGLRYSGAVPQKSKTDQITVAGKTYPRPASMTDAQWEAYKKYAAGVK